MELTIITDHKWRNLLYGYELTDKERGKFDYILADEFDTHDFFRYKGQVYDIGEFMRIENDPDLAGWQGYSNDSYFSGVLLNLSPDGEKYQVGRYYS